MSNVHFVNHSASNAFRLLIWERLFHGICMGSAALLPAYLLSHGLDEVYFGSLTTISAVCAIMTILSMPAFITRAPIGVVALASSMLMGAGFVILVVASLFPVILNTACLFGFPMLAVGWVVHFTLGSIKVSSVSSDATRQRNFMIYAAFSTLGISLGPIIGTAIISTTGSYPILFVSLVCVAGLGFLLTMMSKFIESPDCIDASRHIGLVSHTQRSILMSPAIFFVVMVYFQSAIFTILINFQVVFATQIGLSTSVFFACWAFGIMAPRLLLGGWIAKRDNRIVLPLLTACLAVALWLLAAQPSSNLWYGLTAIGLGVFYGLSYPIVQAEAVKYAPAHGREVILISFSLAYFVAFYSTPLAAGFVVKSYDYETLFFIAGWVAVAMAALQVGFYFPKALLSHRRRK